MKILIALILGIYFGVNCNLAVIILKGKIIKCSYPFVLYCKALPFICFVVFYYQLNILLRVIAVSIKYG